MFSKQIGKVLIRTTSQNSAGTLNTVSVKVQQ